MKVIFKIQRQIQLSPEVVEEKINRYLKKYFYRITERGEGFIIFKDDEYSDRKRFRSDYHNRIGEGKFEFNSNDQGTIIRLIYLTPVLYPAFLILLFSAFGIYTKSIMPIFFSFAFVLPIIYKVYNMKENVFNNILEC